MRQSSRFRHFIRVLMLSLIVAHPEPLRAQQDPDEEETREDPGARARHWLDQRKDNGGELAPDALIKARQELDRLWTLQKQQRRQRDAAGISAWEWLGPGNVGGRVRTILIHPANPNTMFVGSVSGGIWRTDNGGASWSPVNDFMANLAVTSIVMDPTNYNVLYAATGEGFGNYDAIRGSGIFKSNDGGVSWNQISSTNSPSFYYVNRLAHHPSQANTLLAATGSGIWKTTDGGLYWNLMLSVNSATDVKFHPSFPNHVLAGTSAAAYYSSDGGDNWFLQTNGAPGKLPMNSGRCEVAFAPSTLLVMYASLDRNGGELWRGGFGATNWTLMNSGSGYIGTQGWYDNALWVDPFNPDIVVAAGVFFFRSMDAGSTMTGLFMIHSDHHTIVQHPGFNGTTNRIVYVGNDGGIQMTSDIYNATQATHWTALNNNLGITQFLGGAASPDGSIIVGGTQDNSQVHYRPPWGTGGWRKAPYGDGGFSAVNYNNPNYIFGEYSFLLIERSTDGGTTYTQKIAGLQDGANPNLATFVAPFVMDPNNPGILVAGGKRIWRTLNSADDWYRIRDSIASREACTAIDVAKGNSNIIWVGYASGVRVGGAGGTVSYTTNAGGSWTNVDSMLPNRYITDIAINPSNSSEVLVTVGGYTTDNVWITTNSGASWALRMGTAPFSLPALQVNTVRYHPGNENWIYVGTDLGVFASEDKGLHWNVLPLYGQNEGPANVGVDELFWQGGEYLLAATHGRGMYRAHTAVYVAVDTQFPPGTGTLQNPFNLIQLGIDAMGDGVSLFILPGVYMQAPLLFDRPGWVVAPSGNVLIR